MKKALLLMTAVALLAVGCTEKRDADELRAEKLMAKMTLAEKIGQLSQFVPKNSIVTGPDGSPVDVKNVIKEGADPCSTRGRQRKLLNIKNLP